MQPNAYLCSPDRGPNKTAPNLLSVKPKTMVLLSTPADYLPVAMMFVVAIGFVLFTMFVTHLLGPRRKSTIKLDTFECGIESQGNSRLPFSIKYFLIAILFVLFDVEVIFMYPWAVNFAEWSQTGLAAFFEMVVFLGLLVLGLVYIIRKGALKWE
jgi:NADH-quinone oxidoreductase subunit A